jgi:hypothetical protein
VENEGVEIVLLAAFPSVDVVASVASAPGGDTTWAEKLTPVKLASWIVTDWEVGAKVTPVCVGVTLYVPFARSEKE